MKIKTIWDENPHSFDTRVNKYLEEGWILVKRQLLDAPRLDDSVFYAELLLKNKSGGRTPGDDILQAMRTVRTLCSKVPESVCDNNGCPLAAWCDKMSDVAPPEDWVLPGEEAAQ